MKIQSFYKKIGHKKLLLGLLLGAMFICLPTFLPISVNAAACGNADACEIAASRCRSNDGVWDSTAGTCSGSNSNSGSSNSSSNNLPQAREPDSDCDGKDEAGNTVDNDGANCGIVGLLNTVFNFVSGGIALAVIGNIIFAGIQYSIAQGDPSTASKAKKRISGALIAFLMYLGLYGFLQWLIPGGVF